MTGHNYLLQRDWRDLRIPKLGSEEWTVVYLSVRDPGEHGAAHLIVAPVPPARHALKSDSWDLRIGAPVPGLAVRHEGGKQVVVYDSGVSKGFCNLVLLRSFHGVRPKRLELSEEFRLFHNLDIDHQSGRYVRVLDHGEVEVVVRPFADGLEVLTSALLQFLSAKQVAGLFWETSDNTCPKENVAIGKARTFPPKAH